MPLPRSATSAAGNQLLVGYVVPEDPEAFDQQAATERLREELPAALVPLLAIVDTLPTRTSGKVDRDALPWPLPGMDSDGPAAELERDRRLAGRALDEGPRRAR